MADMTISVQTVTSNCQQAANDAKDLNNSAAKVAIPQTSSCQK